MTWQRCIASWVQWLLNQPEVTTTYTSGHFDTPSQRRTYYSVSTQHIETYTQHAIETELRRRHVEQLGADSDVFEQLHHDTQRNLESDFTTLINTSRSITSGT